MWLEEEHTYTHTHRRQGESVRGDDDEGRTMAHKQTRMTKQHYHI